MKTRTLEVIGSLPFNTVFLHFAVAAYASIVHANIVLRSSRFCSFTDQTQDRRIMLWREWRDKETNKCSYLFIPLFIYIYIYIYVRGCAR
jgi:hypothetical protein